MRASLRSIHPLLLLLIALPTVVAGCGLVQNMIKDMGTVDKSVSAFHEQLNSADFHGIYATTDEMFRKVTSQEKFTALLDAVHRKLGNETNASRGNFHENWDTNWGKTATVSYTTHFEGGDASEIFVWRFNGNRLLLLNYTINSDALILK